MKNEQNLDQMYPNNIYIKNFQELTSDRWDHGTSLDVFDRAHGLKRDNVARAQYFHWLSEKLNDPKIFTSDHKKILGIED